MVQCMVWLVVNERSCAVNSLDIIPGQHGTYLISKISLCPFVVLQSVAIVSSPYFTALVLKLCHALLRHCLYSVHLHVYAGIFGNLTS